MFCFTEFNFGCGAILSERTGSFRPPGTEDNGQYSPRLRCYWIIPATPNHRTYLRFRGMDIELHESCSFDYVQVMLIFNYNIVKPIHVYPSGLMVGILVFKGLFFNTLTVKCRNNWVGTFSKCMS